MEAIVPARQGHCCRCGLGWGGECKGEGSPRREEDCLGGPVFSLGRVDNKGAKYFHPEKAEGEASRGLRGRQGLFEGEMWRGI